MEKNENCLRGLRCPECENDEELIITSLVETLVTDDGAEPLNGNFEWDENNAARCPKCGCSGTVSDFEVQLCTGCGKELEGSDPCGDLCETCADTHIYAVVCNIGWDKESDGVIHRVNLPSVAVLDYLGYTKEEVEAELDEYGADVLSDKYGFCVFGFNSFLTESRENAEAKASDFSKGADVDFISVE